MKIPVKTNSKHVSKENTQILRETKRRDVNKTRTTWQPLGWIGLITKTNMTCGKSRSLVYGGEAQLVRCLHVQGSERHHHKYTVEPACTGDETAHA